MKFKILREHFVFTCVCAIVSIYSVLIIKCEERVNEDATHKSTGNIFGKEGYAFFALRICHHVFHRDSGEFFSPDYLCSSPPLWCNWTIQVKLGKQIHLHLEDFTPADACHLKNDQIHLDESPSFGRHRILERCWGKVMYVSQSSTLHVVLLIGRDPRPPHRGFYAHYHARWPPRVEEPKANGGKGVEQGAKMTNSHLLEDGDDVMVVEPTMTDFSSSVSVEFGFTGLPTSSSATTVTQPETEVFISHNSAFEENMSTLVWNSERLPDHNSVEDLGHKRAAPVKVTPSQGKLPPEHSTTSRVHPFQSTPPELWHGTGSNFKNVEVAPFGERTPMGDGDEHAVGQLPLPHVTSSAPFNANGGQTGVETDESMPGKKYPNVVEVILDSGSKELLPSLAHSSNSSQLLHLPGDYLFEVAVEIYTNPRKVRNLDRVVMSLQKTVEDMVQGELGFNPLLKAISSERIKKLHAGVLFIMWLQFMGGPEGTQIYDSVSPALRRLLKKVVWPGAGHFNATFIASISTEDVNECRTQLELCDDHADCVNLFGTYTCRCHPGFEDMSHLGSWGTVCMDPAASRSPVSPMMLHALYALCFLLSLFLLVLLCVTVVLYRHHYRGVFLVPCGHDGCDGDNDANHDLNHGDSRLAPPPPPPPPVCRVRESCPSVGLPLLRFSSLVPPDGPGCAELDEVAKL